MTTYDPEYLVRSFNGEPIQIIDESGEGHTINAGNQLMNLALASSEKPTADEAGKQFALAKKICEAKEATPVKCFTLNTEEKTLLKKKNVEANAPVSIMIYGAMDTIIEDGTPTEDPLFDEDNQDTQAT